MSIKPVEFTYKKPNLRYDSERKKWIGYKVDVRAGRKRYRPTFRTKSEAEQFVTTLKAKTTYQGAGLKYTAPGDVSLADLFARRLKQLKNPKEVKRATRIFALFEGIFDAPPKVTAIRKANFQTYINERLATGVKPETVDREITIIASALNQGSVLFPDELEDYEPPTIVRPKCSRRKRKRRVITDAEKDAIVWSILGDRLAHENPQRTDNRPTIAWIFEVGWLLGLRLSEILGLRKTDADRSSHTLTVRRFKTKSTSLLEFLPDRVFDIFDAAAAKSTTEYIFDLTCSEHTFTDTVAEACRANKIPYGRNNPEGVTFHSTRHSFTSRLSKNTDIATAREYTDHSSATMVDYYSHADEDSKRQAMERMYGNGREAELTEIWKKVRAGKMTKKAFLKALK